MARISFDGVDDLIDGLNQIQFDKLAPKMLKEASPILEKNITSQASAHIRTSSMVDSIKPTGVKKGKDGYIITVRPTGTDGKGLRNMEKAAYLEYGTYKQAATPVFAPAIAQSRASVEQKMKEVFDEAMESLSI